MIGYVMKKYVISVLVLAFLLAVPFVMATTEHFDPLIQYLHKVKDIQLSFTAGVLLILGAVAGFYLVYRVLVALGRSTLPEK